MNHKLKYIIVLLIGSLSLSGCAGHDRILFVTKTNVGLDIDNKPPTAEITIARRELAITPTFQDAMGNENTLPLLASFGLTGNFLNPEITSRFAGGTAAVILAEGPESSATENSSSICLSEKPDTRPFLKWLWQTYVWNYKEDTRAFYFATDTSFGLKVGWDGTSGPYPDTLKLGYNRKELAFPPIFVKKEANCEGETPHSDAEQKGKKDKKDVKCKWEVSVPSFFASLDNSSTVAELSRTGTTHVQFFATGKAATEFVRRADVNAAMNKKMFPHDSLSITPTSPRVTPGGTMQFKAAGGVEPYKYSISVNQSGGATVDEGTGFYKAGSTAGKTDKVKAIDSSTPPIAIETTVNVR